MEAKEVMPSFLILPTKLWLTDCSTYGIALLLLRYCDDVTLFVTICL